MIDERHEKEMRAVLRLIQAVQAKGGGQPVSFGQRMQRFFAHLRLRFTLEGSLLRLACEGMGVFVLGIFVGLGCYTFYEVLREALAG